MLLLLTSTSRPNATSIAIHSARCTLTWRLETTASSSSAPPERSSAHSSAGASPAWHSFLRIRTASGPAWHWVAVAEAAVMVQASSAAAWAATVAGDMSGCLPHVAPCDHAATHPWASTAPLETVSQPRPRNSSPYSKAGFSVGGFAVQVMSVCCDATCQISHCVPKHVLHCSHLAAGQRGLHAITLPVQWGGPLAAALLSSGLFARLFLPLRVLGPRLALLLAAHDGNGCAA